MTTEYATLLSSIYHIYHETSLRMGLSDAEHIILYVICTRGNTCDKGELYKKSGLTRMALSNAMNKLQNAGIITVVRNSDKSVTATLSEKGKELADNTVRKMLDIEEEILSGWEESDGRRFMELSSIYLSELKEKVQDLDLT